MANWAAFGIWQPEGDEFPVCGVTFAVGDPRSAVEKTPRTRGRAQRREGVERLLYGLEVAL